MGRKDKEIEKLGKRWTGKGRRKRNKRIRKWEEDKGTDMKDVDQKKRRYREGP